MTFLEDMKVERKSYVKSCDFIFHNLERENKLKISCEDRSYMRNNKIHQGKFICDTKTKNRFDVGTFIRAVRRKKIDY